MGKKKETDKTANIALENYREGQLLLVQHPLFSEFRIYERNGSSCMSSKDTAFADKSTGDVITNQKCRNTPDRWAYCIAHARLHFAFGHFDADRMPGYDIEDADGTVKHFVDCDPKLWNIACDMYIANFLASVKFRGSVLSSPSELLHVEGDEKRIYEHLKEKPETAFLYNFGTTAEPGTDMRGIDPHEKGFLTTGRWSNEKITDHFAVCLAKSVSRVVDSVSGPSITNDKIRKECREAAEWFLGHYPLLGGVAAAFSIVCDEKICEANEISIAAVDPARLEIYISPFARLSAEEWKFVLAHEYLHAGLGHQERCQGRDPFLWNVACDYVINGWLREMGVGSQPAETLYDESFRNMSCESVYDALVGDMKKYLGLLTFRGPGRGDILGKGGIFGLSSDGKGKYTGRDDFCRTALMQGFEEFTERGRGTIPAGLAEEIRALGVPPVPWDVQLAKWFDEHFVPVERKHTYARASRRQSVTPDIPRPGKKEDDALRSGRTFGVVIDTSGSMTEKEIAYALGAVASYSLAKDVPFARVVFCDATAYDAGYMSPEEISGRVEVKGRGGTVLQPAVDLLERAEDFPKDGPILLITDGEIEEHLTIHHEHAYLMPAGARLPFQPKGGVFRFYNQNQ